MPWTAFRSAPVQNARSPAPVTTSTRAASSVPNRSISASMRPAVSASTQLWTSGRFTRSTRTGPRSSVSMFAMGGLPSVGRSACWNATSGMGGPASGNGRHVTEIQITALEPHAYGVETTEGALKTSHKVRVPQAMLDDLFPNGVDEERLVRESFEFML